MYNSNQINKTNRLSYYNRSNNFINLEYFHNFVTGKGYFEFIINPFYSPRSFNEFMKKTLDETIYSLSLEKGYQKYVSELYKRSPKSRKEIDTLLDQVRHQAFEKVNDIMQYFTTHLDDYTIDEIVRVTYDVANTFKGIKVVNYNRGARRVLEEKVDTPTPTTFADVRAENLARPRNNSLDYSTIEGIGRSITGFGNIISGIRIGA